MVGILGVSKFAGWSRGMGGTSFDMIIIVMKIIINSSYKETYY